MRYFATNGYEFNFVKYISKLLAACESTKTLQPPQSFLYTYTLLQSTSSSHDVRVFTHGLLKRRTT